MLKDKNSRTRIVLYAVVACAAAVFVFTLAHATIAYNPDPQIPETQMAQQAALSYASSTLGTPVHLSIPAINVDASIRAVGITYRGNMGVPDNFTDVGWYRYGALPGTIGSAVIDGHVDNGLAEPAVFKRLKELVVGDDIYVTMSEGKTLHFKVVDKETYFYTAAPLKTIFNRSDMARLNLITCDGEWVSNAATDDHRVVIFTELVK